MTKLALVIGHTVDSQGASNNYLGISEFVFNSKLAYDIQRALESFSNLTTEVIIRGLYKGLPDKIDSHKPDFIISLHCNAFNKSTSGTEVLYYYKSIKGKQLAELLQTNLVKALELPNRGVKPKTTEERGGFLLRYTNAPCVISEPFFIDNNKDINVVFNSYDKLVDAYVNTIKEYANGLRS